MKRLLILSVILLSVATIALGQNPAGQRVHPTALNPPTACVPGHLYPNATTHKLYQGSSVGGCPEISGTAAAAAWGSITGTLASQTDLATALGLKVAGPASAVDGHLAVFDGTTGKLIKDGGAVPSAGASPAGSDGDHQMKSGSSFAASQLNEAGGTVSGRSILLRPVLGSELTVNGGFTASASGWTLGSGWAFGSDAVTHTPGDTAVLTQDTLIPTVGKYYRIVVTVSAATAGELDVRLGAAGDSFSGEDGADDYTFDVLAEDASVLTLTPDTDFDGTITAISVKASSAPFSVQAHDGTPLLWFGPFGSIDFGMGFTVSQDLPGAYLVSTIRNTSGAANSGAGLELQTSGDNTNSAGLAYLRFVIHKDDATEKEAAFALNPYHDVFTLNHTLQLSPKYTVATLPICDVDSEGTFTSITDATTPTYLGIAVGGGAVHAPVWCDGTNWVTH